MKNLFAYHLTHKFGRFSGETYYTNSPNPQRGNRLFVLSGNYISHPHIDYFLEGLFEIRDIEEGSFFLLSKSGENDRYNRRLSLSKVLVPDNPIALSLTESYDKNDIHDFFTSGQNFNSLQPRHEEEFKRLLIQMEDNRSLTLSKDLLKIIDNTNDATEREALIQARIGQGEFRRNVIKAWGIGEVCAVTGIAIREMLIASHIRSWRNCNDKSDRLDGANGILLCSHIDKLFDKYLLSFELVNMRWKLVLDNRLDKKLLSSIGIVSGMELNTHRIGFSEEHRLSTYLSEHHRFFMQKSNS